MAEEVVMNVYGMFLTPEESIERSTWHDTTWIEQEIPQALYKKLSKLIDKEVKAYEKKCGCGLCKLHKR